MKNQVIKVLNIEHGKKVIEYWNSQGVDTKGSWGQLCEDEGDTCIYYGVINGEFLSYSLNKVNAYNAEIIELPEEEFDMTTNEGRLAYAEKHYPIGTVIKSIHTGCEIELTGKPSSYGISNIMAYGEIPNNPCMVPDIYYRGKWAEIVKKEKNKIMETQRLSRAGLKEIHSVACSAWKMNLERYGARNPLEYYIELTQEEVDAMFGECTKEQLPIVSKYLKQDDGSVDLSRVVYDEVGVLLDNVYIIKHKAEPSTKDSFWLNERYNWNIEINSLGWKCLVPTKKK